MAIIDEYIGRIDRCLSTPDIEEAGDLVEEIVATFIGPDPDIKKGLDRYKARAVALGSTPNFDNAGDLRKLKGKGSEGSNIRPRAPGAGDHRRAPRRMPQARRLWRREIIACLR